MLTTTVQAADSRGDLLIHDIRTPLATISGYAQLLRRRAAQGGPELLALVDALQHIEEAAKRVGNLLCELADVQSQSGTPAGILHRQPADLVNVRGVSPLTASVPDWAYALSWCCKLCRNWCPRDPARLERSIANLIDNPLKYNLDARLVVVNVERVHSWAVISMADWGIGIGPRTSHGSPNAVFGQVMSPVGSAAPVWVWRASTTS